MQFLSIIVKVGEMKNILEELKENSIILVVAPKNKFSDKIMSFSKQISKEAKRCCFISLMNPYSTLVDKFEKNSINTKNFLFVDMLTSSVKKSKDSASCLFVDSPSNLTKLSIIYSDLIKVIGIDYAILDSLQTFLVYRNKSMVTSFVHNLITKSRVDNVKLLLITSEEDSKDGIVDELSTFVDKVIIAN